MSTPSFSRRRMLAALAAAGGASRLAPFLPAAVHAAGTTPKRILTVFSPMGYLENSFWPSGTGSNFTLGETQTALKPYQSKLLYLDGLALYGPEWYFSNDDNEHSAGGTMVFTGAKKASYANGPSIEQAIADFQYAQVKTKFRALALGVNSGTPAPHSGVFFSKSQTPVTAQNNAQATFDMLFDGFTGPSAPTTGGGTTPAPVTPSPDSVAAERRRKQRQSVLNLVKKDLMRVRGLAGKDDQKKMDAHLDGISSLENRLGLLSPSTPPTAPMQTTTAPPAPAGTAASGCAKPTLTGGALIETVHAQMDLIAAAFACDMTRHASLQLGYCDGGVDAVAGVNQHDTTHAIGDKQGQPTDIDNHKKYDRWFADRWAYLLGKLDSIPEGSGTVLDNTLVLFGSDTTTLQNLNLGPHNHARFPLWIAGGGGFAFKTGQVLKLVSPTKMPGSPQEIAAQWVPHQRLLTAIAQAFGMNIESFGDNDPGKGGIAALTRV